MPGMNHFHKYQGTGNDFVIVDDRSFKRFRLIRHYCPVLSPAFWYCADGLMLLQNPQGSADFVWFISTPDRQRGQMCGNGGRCLVKFCASLGVSETEAILAVDGPYHALHSNGLVHLKMADVQRRERTQRI